MAGRGSSGNKGIVLMPEEPEKQPPPLPPSEPELIIKADMAGAYYEYKTKAKHWWQFWK